MSAQPDPFLPFNAVRIAPIDNTAGKAMGRMIGDMTNATRERLEAMDMAAVAKFYGVPEQSVRDELNWQLGRAA